MRYHFTKIEKRKKIAKGQGGLKNEDTAIRY